MEPSVIDTDGGMRVLVRPAREGDQGYVLSTWAQYLCVAGKHCGGGHAKRGERGNQRHACAGARTMVDRFVDHAAVKVVVAADPSSSDDILGWLAFTDTKAAKVVHGVYVRLRYRDRKVARAMMQGAGVYDARPTLYTLPGPCSKSLLNKAQFQNATLMRAEEFLT